MKKLLAMASVILLLVGSLLMPSVLASEGESVWNTSDGVTLDTNTGTFSMGAVEYAVCSTPIDFTAADLDVSVALKTTFSNAYQMISLYFSKDLPTGKPSGDNVAHIRFCLDNGKFGLNHAWLGEQAVGAYCGGYIAFATDTTYTIRFKRVDGMIKMYIDDTLIYGSAGNTDQTVSDFINGLGTGYLTIGTSSSDGGFATQILKVNGKAPLADAEDEGDQEDVSWITSDGVAADKVSGTFSMNAVEYAIRNGKIDFTAADLDISVELKTTFSNGDQFISLYFSKDLPTGKPSGENVAHIRFCLDNGKFGLNHAWLGEQAVGTYCGGYIAFTTDTAYTIRFKRVDGMIKMYIDDILIYGPAGDTDKKVSDFINGLGTGYLTIGTSSSNGGFTTRILKVNGQTPFTPVTVTGIEMASQPTKTIYEYGEGLDVTGGSVKLLYSDNSEKNIPLTADMVSGYAADTEGQQTVTVTFGALTTTFQVTVNPKPVATVTAISMKTNPAKTTYACGEELDLTGAVINVNYSDDTSLEITVGTSMISGYNKATAGKQTVTVTYEGKQTTFEVEVQPAFVTGVTLKTPPAKTTYQKGEELDLTGVEIEVSYSYGEPQTVSVTADMVSGYDKNAAGKQTVTIAYEGKTTTFEVTVPLNTEDKDTLTKEDWIVGQEQDSNEGKVTTSVSYNQDGSIKVSGGSGSKGAYIGLNEKIDLSAEDLDVSWKIRLDEFPIVDEADQANIQFILSDSLTGYNPLYLDEATAFRTRIFRSYGDEFTFPESLFRNPKLADTPGGALMAYAGRTIDLDDENAPTFTFQIKRVEGKIRFLIDGETLYTADGYDADDRLPVKISRALEKEFSAGAYLSIAGVSKEGEPMSFTILEVNGRDPWEGGSGEDNSDGENSGGDNSDPDEPDNSDGSDDPIDSPVTGVAVPVALLTGLAASSAATMLFTVRRRKKRG